jgi:hypothetical protein
MLLVPLLVGTAIVTVAIMSRVDASEDCFGQPRSTRPRSQDVDAIRNPLRHAHPHLRFWIPDDEILGRGASHEKRLRMPPSPGTIGPDIIVGPWKRRQNDSYADAA